jgi:Peptidase C39 family
MSLYLTPWFETLCVACLSGAGFYVGFLFSRLEKYWLLSAIISFVGIVVIGLDSYCFAKGICKILPWVVGRTSFAIVGPLYAMLFATLLFRLKKRRERVFVGILAVVTVLSLSWRVFLAPALLVPYLSGIKTNITSEGVCLQSNSFTCSPAAAVTALKLLGIDGQEGELAILARTTPWGTQSELLCMALNKKYADQGLGCELRQFKTIAEMRQFDAVITSMKLSGNAGHSVAVMQITENHIIIGDPGQGRLMFSLDIFRGEWLHSGIAFKLQKGPGRE